MAADINYESLFTADTYITWEEYDQFHITEHSTQQNIHSFSESVPDASSASVADNHGNVDAPSNDNANYLTPLPVPLQQGDTSLQDDNRGTSSYQADNNLPNIVVVSVFISCWLY
jgi:hypothetical protein